MIALPVLAVIALAVVIFNCGFVAGSVHSAWSRRGQIEDAFLTHRRKP